MSKLKIFTHINHVPNEFEVLKLAEYYDVEFYYLLTNVRKWLNTPAVTPPRPIPKHINWVTAYEPGKYDLAILRLDQQATDPTIGKGQIYRQLNEVIQDIPKLVVNHGVPTWDDAHPEEIIRNGGWIETTRGRRKFTGMKELIGGNFMVVNSYEAAREWGFGYPLIHGLTPGEWWDLPKEPRVVIQLSPGGLEKMYNRQLLSEIKTRVREKVGLDIIHITVNYQCSSWDDYRDVLGRSLIYINPTKCSPMPRSRTEAMLSGCCVLSSRYHGWEEFIQNGVDGFVVPDNPLSYAEAIYQLINFNYQDAVEIGQRGKETAKRLFNTERFLKDLYFIVTEVARGNRPEWKGEKIWDDSLLSLHQIS